MDCKAEWESIHTDDLWVYNKLHLSRVLGYKCGPSGVPVPQPGSYIIRPSFNIMGMGRSARIEYIEENTEHIHPSEFWCEVFTGEHLSVDYLYRAPTLTIRGIRDLEAPLYQWSKWEKVDYTLPFPEVLKNLIGSYDYINCEFIGGKLIEVHFRPNLDFRFGNTVAIPVWSENLDSKYTFIKDEDYLRKGFLID